MKSKVLFFSIVIPIVGAIAANAETPDVMTIMKKSENVLEAMKEGTQKIEFIIRDNEKITNRWIARRAHKKFSDGRRELVVFIKPEEIKGSAYMYWKPIDQPTIEWFYFVPARRVRKIHISEAYTPFFGTDFTYADLGLKDPPGTYKYLGEEEYRGKMAYKIETIPNDRWYYSRIESLIAKDNFLPIIRKYYDLGGRLYKTKFFEDVEVIDNIPMALRIKMVDVQRNHSTELKISDVCFDVEYLRKEDFDPKKLSEALLSPICTVKPFQQK